MKRFASIAAAAAIAATCLVTPASAAESETNCKEFAASFKANGHEGKTAQEFTDGLRAALLKNEGVNSYSDLSDAKKKSLRLQVATTVAVGHKCGVFKEESHGSSPTGSLSLSSSLFGSS